MTYPFFEAWMMAYANETSVKDFMKLGEVCAYHLMFPKDDPAPSMDYSADLPAGFSPQTLLAILDALWERQTQMGLEMQAQDANLSLLQIRARLEYHIEEHKVIAFEKVTQMNLDEKRFASLLMDKAYLTYASSEIVEGIEGGGPTFKLICDRRVAECLDKHEKALG